MKEKLVDICTPKQWKTLVTSELKDEGYPVYGANGVIGYYDEYNHEVETVMVTCRGATCGTVNISKPFSYINGNAMCMDNLREDINVKYLYYALKHYDFSEVISGSAQPQITRQGFNNVIIKIVEKSKQMEIVKVLSKFEEIILKKKNQILEYDQLIKSRFVEMFGDPITNNKGWDVKDLNEITDVRDGTHDSPKYVDIGYPFVTSKNLVNGNIDFSTCQLISKDDLEKINQRSFVDDGDILMPMIGTIGGAIIVKKDRDFAIKNVALIKFNKENSIVDRKFILNVLNSDSMNEFFNSIKKGGTQNFISLGLIRKIPTIIPPLKLQNEFALFVEQVDKLKFAVQKSLDETQTLFDSLMQKYFG